jgi:hypothetical protein
MRVDRSSVVSDSRVRSSERDSNGAITEKLGFSVVAAMSVMRRFSTAGSNTSCCALLNRWTSSTNSTVDRPRASSDLACSSSARTSLTPAVTALSSTKREPLVLDTTAAIVVLPTPGGPQRKTDIGCPDARRRSGEPGPNRCCCPTISSRVVGRSRTASGELAWALPSDPPCPVAGDAVNSPKRSSVTRLSIGRCTVAPPAGDSLCENNLFILQRRADLAS